jgi:hypothetical protein
VRRETIRHRGGRDETIAVRPFAARQALDDVRRLQGVGRRRLGTVWFPLSVFGLIYLGAAPLALFVHRNHLGPYFAVALVIGSFITAHHYKRSGKSDGIETSPWPWLATSVAMTVSGALASMTGFALHSTFINSSGPFLAVAAFFLAYSLISRSTFLLAESLIMALICLVGVAIANGDQRIAAQAASFAALLLISARLQYRHQHSQNA